VSPPILLLVAAFLIVAVLGPWWGIRKLNAASDALTNLTKASDTLDDLVRSQLSEEAGLRGFVATRDREFLAPAGPPNPDFDITAGVLTQLLTGTDVPDALGTVDKIRQSHDQWEQEVALPLLRENSAANQYLLGTRGKILTDDLRANTQELTQELKDARDKVEQRLGYLINTTVIVSALVVAAFAFATVVLGLARATALQRLQREQTLVDALQRTLRVGGTRLPHTEVGFAYASATAEALVGGDLLDSWLDGANDGWILIADASGKGVEAARHSAFVQFAIRALVADDRDPANVVSRFNRLFIDTFADPSVFVVLFLGRLDSRTNTLHYTSAGHPAAFIRRGTMVQQLGPTGPIVGMEYDSPYGLRSVNLRLGETVLLATDGLTESRDSEGRFLGDDGVAQLLATAPMDPQGICDLLIGEAERRANGDIADDLAILAISVVEGEDGSDTAFSTMEAAPRSQ
jgi:CHASE3 domain sensor protein